MFWIYTKQVQTLPVCELHSHEMHTHFNFANIFMPHCVSCADVSLAAAAAATTTTIAVVQ